jgi:hypothetical protein
MSDDGFAKAQQCAITSSTNGEEVASPVMKESIVRTRLFLIISLTIHMLLAILAKYTVLSPVTKVDAYSDKLAVDVIKVSPLRKIIVFRGAAVSSTKSGDLSLPAMNHMKAIVSRKIEAITPEEIVFLPVIARVPFFGRPPLYEPRRTWSEFARARGAGGWSYSLSFQDLRKLKDMAMLKQKIEDFFEALMCRDFESASAIAGGRYQDIQWEETRYANLAEIVSIGEPYMRPKQLVSGVDIISGANLHLRHRMGYGRPVFVPYEIRLAPDQVIKGEVIIRRESTTGKWFFDGGV